MSILASCNRSARNRIQNACTASHLVHARPDQATASVGRGRAKGNATGAHLASQLPRSGVRDSLWLSAPLGGYQQMLPTPRIPYIKLSMSHVLSPLIQHPRSEAAARVAHAQMGVPWTMDDDRNERLVLRASM